ncbi:MAG: DUF2997 domain-containing protein [Verrucomicrobiae bacterium]|nr:DUF2997 domain-containing protein [Verrucomicrobiae bacterium]
MNRTIKITVSPTGEIAIEALNFKGADCEKATSYLEKALGVIGKRVKKPEYDRKAQVVGHQGVGS